MKCKKLILLVVSFVAIGADGQDQPEFKPYQFHNSGIRENDVKGKFELLSGGKLGSEILRNCLFAALIRLGSHELGKPSFSFMFNERRVKSYAKLNESDCLKFSKLIGDPEQYDIVDVCHENDHPFRDDVSDYSIEVSDGFRFARMYLSKTMTACYFVSSDGVRGKYLTISPLLQRQIADILKIYKMKMIRHDEK